MSAWRHIHFNKKNLLLDNTTEMGWKARKAGACSSAPHGRPGQDIDSPWRGAYVWFSKSSLSSSCSNKLSVFILGQCHTRPPKNVCISQPPLQLHVAIRLSSGQWEISISVMLVNVMWDFLKVLSRNRFMEMRQWQLDL